MQFEWIVVDDGSTDNTEEIVTKWIDEQISLDKNGFKIKYHKIKNGGKHRAINYALQSNLCNGKYFFIVDSDDQLTENAIDWIIKRFTDLEKKKVGTTKFCGISGRINQIGDPTKSISKNWTISAEFIDCKNNFRNKYGIIGDQCEIFYTDIIKKYPFPEFKNEKFLTEAVVWNRMSRDNYYIRYFTEAVYLAEYIEDGLTNSGLTKFFENPRGTALFAKEYLQAGKYRGSVRDKVFWAVAWPVFSMISCLTIFKHNN